MRRGPSRLPMRRLRRELRPGRAGSTGEIERAIGQSCQVLSDSKPLFRMLRGEFRKSATDVFIGAIVRFFSGQSARVPCGTFAKPHSKGGQRTSPSAPRSTRARVASVQRALRWASLPSAWGGRTGKGPFRNAEGWSSTQLGRSFGRALLHSSVQQSHCVSAVLR